MYISQTYYDAIAAGTRPVLSGALGIYSITEDDIMEGSFQIDEAMESLPIGGIVTSCLTLVLNNFEGKFDPSLLTTATVMSLTMTVGTETLTLPNYHIVDKKVADNTIMLTLMDMTDTLATPPSINSPITGATWADVVDDILDRFNMTFDTDTAAATKLAGAASVLVMYGQDTYKSVLLHILQYLNLFARISSGSELYIFYPDPDATPIPVTEDMVASIDAEGPHTPTAVSIKAFNGEEFVTSGASGYTATLEGCPLIVGTPDPSGYLTEVSGLSFYNFNLDCIGDPSVQIGDYIEIGGSKLCLVGTKSYKYGGYANLGFKWDIDTVDDFSYAVNTEVDPAVAEQVDDARKVATNYLSADTSGIMVADLENGQQTPSQAIGRNVFIDNNGVHIREGTTDVASFSDSVILGETGKTRQELDYHSMQLIDKEQNVYLHISDLRDSTGKATLTETFDGDGSDTTFIVEFPVSDEVSATDSSDPTNTATRSGKIYTFANAPASGATVTIVYKTTSDEVKAYTFGQRATNSTIGAYSVAFGRNSIASGSRSFAESGDAYGSLSHAECGGIASGMGSHAEGSTASGKHSHAEGSNNIAHGRYSHAEGYGSTASVELDYGEACHAEGYHTKSYGRYGSHSEGYYTVASGDMSHAEGDHCEASGWASHAQNIGTIAQDDAQTAIGQYNIADSSSLLIIGNGLTENQRRNALTVDWDGTAWLAGQLDFAKYRGVRLIDNANLQYYALYDTGNNFFLGYGGATTRHHKGNTYISSGHNGTSGNDTIYVAIPNAANNSATSYAIAHANNIEEVNTYGNGTYTMSDIAGYGYTVNSNSTDGYRLYVLIPLPKNAPTGKTITVTALTSTVIRGVNGAILNGTATSYVKSATALSNGLLRVYLTNLPSTNFVAHTPISIATNITFTVS